MRKSWDEWYMELAEFWTHRSKDPKRKVGAIITLDNYCIGTGFNGFPRNIEDTKARLADKVIKNMIMIHAEENALRVAGHRGDTCYVTYFPCAPCLGKLSQAGITRVVVPKLESDTKWNQGLVLELAEEAGIDVEVLDD